MSIFNRKQKEENNENKKPKRNFFKALLVALGLSAGVATLTTGCGDSKQQNVIEQESKKDKESTRDEFIDGIKVKTEKSEKVDSEVEKKEQEKADEKEYEDIIKAANETYEEKTGYDTDDIEISYIHQKDASQAYVLLWKYTDEEGKNAYVKNNYFTVNDAAKYGLQVSENKYGFVFPSETILAIDKTHHKIMYGAARDDDEYCDFIVLSYKGQSGESVNPGGTNPKNCIKINDIYNKYNKEISKDEFSKDLFNATVEEMTKEQENER